MTPTLAHIYRKKLHRKPMGGFLFLLFICRGLWNVKHDDDDDDDAAADDDE